MTRNIRLKNQKDSLTRTTFKKY